MNSVGDLLVGLVVLVGLVGVVVQVLPGGLLVAGAIIVWGVVTGGVAGWTVVTITVVVTVLATIGKYLLAGRHLKRAGVPSSTLSGAGSRASSASSPSRSSGCSSASCWASISPSGCAPRGATCVAGHRRGVAGHRATILVELAAALLHGRLADRAGGDLTATDRHGGRTHRRVSRAAYPGGAMTSLFENLALPLPRCAPRCPGCCPGAAHRDPSGLPRVVPPRGDGSEDDEPDDPTVNRRTEERRAEDERRAADDELRRAEAEGLLVASTRSSVRP